MPDPEQNENPSLATLSSLWSDTQTDVNAMLSVRAAFDQQTPPPSWEAMCPALLAARARLQAMLNAVNASIAAGECEVI